MATTVSLITSTRRYMRDFPEDDVLTASVSSAGTTLTVADSTIYGIGWTLQLEQEAVRVRAKPTATTLTVFRGAKGTTAATHANSTTLLLQPAYLDLEILDALNYAKDAMFPHFYKEVEDTSLTTLASTYEYTVPNFPSATYPIPRIAEIELKTTGQNDYRRTRAWKINRGATPKIQFRFEPNAGDTIRIHGYGPFPDLTIAGSTDTKFPDNALKTLVIGAAEYLLASGEAGRVRVDTGMVDNRENANRVGSSMQASNALLSRFERSVLRHAMPAMPLNVVTVL